MPEPDLTLSNNIRIGDVRVDGNPGIVSAVSGFKGYIDPDQVESFLHIASRRMNAQFGFTEESAHTMLSIMERATEDMRQNLNKLRQNASGGR